MKIAFVNQPWNTATLAAQSGSIAIFTHEVARRLASSHDVTVYARRGPGRTRGERDGALEYRHLPVLDDYRLVSLFERSAKVNRLRRAVRRRVPWRTARPRFTARTYSLWYIVRATLDLRRRGCDVVHLYNFSQFVPVVQAIHPQAVIALHMQCEWLTQLDPTVIGPRLKGVDLILGCSEYVTRKIRERYPSVADRCQTIYNGVDVDRFAPKPGPPRADEQPAKRLLFVGRVSPEKGVHVLAKATQVVMEHMPHCRLTIVGPEAVPPVEFIVAVSDDPKVKDLGRFYAGGYLAAIRSALPPPVAERVVFTGNVAHGQVVRQYQDADVFVFPSVWEEPFGIPLVEAMAVGLPVIATRGGGIDEIVADGKTGVLVERGDVAGLAEAMLKVLSDDDLRRSIGQAGRRRAIEVFSYDRIAGELGNHYQGAAARRRGSPRS